ncbi:MAG TPA: CUB domain-containing protein, partial [Flavobacteriales bacterium]|nr:CUB domain-containing protein [Flavobacteriales bacterium]
QQLYVRVWREAGADGTFNICAQRTDPTLCIGNVTDPGGPLADYGNSLTTTDQYCSTKAGDAVTLTFSQFDLEQGWDFLSIYDGTSAGAPLIGTYTGTNSPGVVTASISALNPTGCLTLVFTSDFIIVRPGYLAKITCAPGVAQVPPVGDCGSFVYDPGGVGAGYPINIGNPPNPTWTAFYCPNNPGDVVTLDWSTFQVENNWDHLYIYYGTSAIPANLISSGNPAGFAPNNGPGAWWGAGIPDISGNPAIGGGCLFLEFYSDASVTGNWAAQVICGPPPPPPPPPGLSCGNTFLDPGGAGNYANNVDVTYTICAPAGQVVNVTFNQFSLEANWDKLYVYDGPNTASPQIASTNGTGNGPTAGPGSFWVRLFLVRSSLPASVLRSASLRIFQLYLPVGQRLLHVLLGHPMITPVHRSLQLCFPLLLHVPILHPITRMLAVHRVYPTQVVEITKAGTFGSNSPLRWMGRY